MSAEEIRAKALELAVTAQAARGISRPAQILVLAQLYEIYIQLGTDATKGMMKMAPWSDA